jgi:glucoselysine-6-phosphate deglycase
VSAVPGDERPRRVRGFTLEQPRVLERTLREIPAALARLAGPVGPYREVRLVGSGSSKNALLATAPAFRRVHACPVAVEGPLEFLRDLAAAGRSGRSQGDVLTVVVSQSGSSATTLEALEAGQNEGMRTLALTGEAESPFGLAAHERVVLPIGREDIGPKTKGYTSSLAALLAIAEATSAEPVPSVLPHDPAVYAAWFAARMPTWDALGASLAERHVRADHVMTIGAGRHIGSALEGSLKLQEMAGMHASTFDLEEALHGRFHGLGPGSVALFVVGEPDDERLAAGAAAVLRGLGVTVEVLSSVDGPAPGPSSASGRSRSCCRTSSAPPTPSSRPSCAPPSSSTPPASAS